jgi:hypothetical protein
MNEWMLLINNRILENACKDDTELRAVLGDSIGNPQLMKERVSDLQIIIIFFFISHSIIIIIMILILLLCSFVCSRWKIEFEKRVKIFAGPKLALLLPPKSHLESMYCVAYPQFIYIPNFYYFCSDWLTATPHHSSSFLPCSFNPLDSFIWFEFYGSPSDRDVNLIGSVCLFFFSQLFFFI